MRRWGAAVRNLLFPSFCRECNAPVLTNENIYFCPTCWERPRRIESPFCDCCGRSLVGRVGFGEVRNYRCADCRKAPPHAWDRTYGAVTYEGAIAEAIKLLKFDERLRIAPPLIDELRTYVEREMPQPRYRWIVPVPLHRVRRRDEETSVDVAREDGRQRGAHRVARQRCERRPPRA